MEKGSEKYFSKSKLKRKKYVMGKPAVYLKFQWNTKTSFPVSPRRPTYSQDICLAFHLKDHTSERSVHFCESGTVASLKL